MFYIPTSPLSICMTLAFLLITQVAVEYRLELDDITSLQPNEDGIPLKRLLTTGFMLFAYVMNRRKLVNLNFYEKIFFFMPWILSPLNVEFQAENRKKDASYQKGKEK